MSRIDLLLTYKVPAKPAALCLSNVGSGGRHMRINSWSASITTPGNAGNHIRKWINPYKKNNERLYLYLRYFIHIYICNLWTKYYVSSAHKIFILFNNYLFLIIIFRVTLTKKHNIHLCTNIIFLFHIRSYYSKF